MSGVPDKIRDILLKKERKIHIGYREGSAEEGEIVEYSGNMIEVVSCVKDTESENMYWIYGYLYDFRGLESQ